MKPFNKKEYDASMKRILEIMNKGEGNLTKKETTELRNLALAAQQYEQSKFDIPAPKTLGGIIEMKMYERKLKQKELARELNISNTKLSLILAGKQKPDIGFLKGIHKKLEIDANLILEYA